jgi:hypothetical protein
MLNRRDDDDLHQLFVRWRREESATAPSFARMLTAARKRLTTGQRTRRWRYLAAAGALAASVALWLAWGLAPLREGPPMTAGPTAPVAPIGAHETLTDLLLDVPEGAWWSTVWWDAEDSPGVSMLETTLAVDPVEVPELVADEAYVPMALEGE